MTIDGDAGGPEDDFVPGNNVAPMIYAIDRSSEEPAGAAGYVHRAVDDTLGETEVNPLLAGPSATVTIDASIGKLRRTTVDEMENKSRRDEGASEFTAKTTGPPDGGLRAWMIMIGSFAINGVLFSIINTYSLIYMELQRRLTEAGESEVSSKAGSSDSSNPPRSC